MTYVQDYERVCKFVECAVGLQLRGIVRLGCTLISRLERLKLFGYFHYSMLAVLFKNNYLFYRTTKININGKNHKLARYNVEVDDPRPESYYEDFNDAQHFDSVDEQREFYQNMKSGTYVSTYILEICPVHKVTFAK